MTILNADACGDSAAVPTKGFLCHSYMVTMYCHTCTAQILILSISYNISCRYGLIWTVSYFSVSGGEITDSRMGGAEFHSNRLKFSFLGKWAVIAYSSMSTSLGFYFFYCELLRK